MVDRPSNILRVDLREAAPNAFDLLMTLGFYFFVLYQYIVPEAGSQFNSGSIQSERRIFLSADSIISLERRWCRV